MNVYLKTTALVSATIIGLALWHFISKQLSTSFLDQLETVKIWALVIVAAIAAVAAIIFLFFNFFREIMTQSILKRAEGLLILNIDASGQYLYVAAKCQQSGDETGSSYSIYLHYLFTLRTGEKLKYNANVSPDKSAEALHAFTNKLNNLVSVSLNHNTNLKFVENPEYGIHVRHFKTPFDFGFEIECTRNGHTKPIWKRKI